MMKIYLARHGQSRWQVERNDGDWNSPLTELGLAQAQHLGQWLASGPVLNNGSRMKVGALFASPYTRAQQTAASIERTLGLPITTHEDLREASFLVSDHLPASKSPGQPLPDYALTDTYQTFKAQSERALQSLVDVAGTRQTPVLAVSHGGLISTMLRLITGSDAVSFWIYNASLHLIEWKRGRWHLVYLNLWDHLPPHMRTF
jgi:probable phosphoglycerate mutase